MRDKLQQIDGQRQDAVQECERLRQQLGEAVEVLEGYAVTGLEGAKKALAKLKGDRVE